MTLNEGGSARHHSPDVSALGDDQPIEMMFGRRRFLVIGGASVATAALLAACGEDSGGEAGIGRVGNAPSTTALPAADVNDVVLLRTSSSLEHTLIDMYDRVLDGNDLVDPLVRQYFTELRDIHTRHAETLEELTTDRGGEPWRCGNPRLETVVLTPVMRAILGAPATDTAPATTVSDDPQRDVKTFAHAMETMAAASHQAFVGILSEPDLRRESAQIATRDASHSALLALMITGTPAGYVTPEGIVEATGVTTTTAAPATTQDIAAPSTAAGATPPPPATPIPAVYAITGQFGSLAATPLVVGAPNEETGNRLSLNLETPSLNTFVYEYMNGCDA